MARCHSLFCLIRFIVVLGCIHSLCNLNVKISRDEYWIVQIIQDFSINAQSFNKNIYNRWVNKKAKLALRYPFASRTGPQNYLLIVRQHRPLEGPRSFQQRNCRHQTQSQHAFKQDMELRRTAEAVLIQLAWAETA